MPASRGGPKLRNFVPGQNIAAQQSNHQRLSTGLDRDFRDIRRRNLGDVLIEPMFTVRRMIAPSGCPFEEPESTHQVSVESPR